MSLHKLTAGDGYTYLTRQVAAHDATNRGYENLGEYYSEKGEAPGVWMGRGLSGVPDFPLGEHVAEAQMVALFGEGRHPNAEEIHRSLRAAGASELAIDRGSRLGSPYRIYQQANMFHRRSAGAFRDYNTTRGLPVGTAVPAQERARMRTELARRMFGETYGRGPVDARELSGHLARVSRQSTTAVAGYDLTFSPVKSVSVLWALAPREIAQQLERAHNDAVKDTLAWLEDHVAYTRRGRNGVAQVEVRGLIAAAFTHRDSRAGDPDLHTHVAISNKVQTLDGRWLALDGRPLFKNNVTASERYNTRLEALLIERLGVRFAERPGTDPARRPVREIVGIGGELPRRWSSRRAAIDLRRAVLSAKFQADHGRPPTPTEALSLAQQATCETRQAKHEPRSAAEQRAAWRIEALALLGGERGLRAYVGGAIAHRQSRRDAQQPTAGWVTATAETVLSEVACSRATWQEHHVRAETERQVRMAGVRLADLDQAVGAVVARALSPQLSLALDSSEPVSEPAELAHLLCRSDGSSVYTVAGSRLYTSRQIVAAERAIVDAAGRRDGQVVPAETVELALLESAANGVELNPGQVQLARELATSGARVQLALAPAGTGKTTALRVLSRSWIAGGGTVVGLAPSAVAAGVLREQLGADTDTLAKLIHALSTRVAVPGWATGIGAGSLVVIDEAGMAATTDLAKAVEFVIAQGGSVRLIGDDRQLAAFGAGGVLRDIADTHGAVSLSQVMRFTHPDTGAPNHGEGAASLALRDGDPAAIGFYLDHQRLHVGDLSTVTDGAFAAWRADRDAGRDAIMLAPTRELVTELNQRARRDRLAAQPRPGGRQVGLADQSEAGTGDPIITRHNNRRIPVGATDWVKNGDRWTVQAVRESGALEVLHLPTGRHITLPADYVAAHVVLGYASTVHGAQGVTADSCHTVATGQETRPLLYVAMTRGRHANHLYLSTAGDGDPHSVITRDALLPPTAVDLFTRVLARDGGAASASSQARALTEPADRLQAAADRYHDTLFAAAQDRLGHSTLAGIDVAAEAALPGLTAADAYPTLRGHLTLAALDGADPADLLRAAVSNSRDLADARDVAAVLDWRLDRTGTCPGPLPWLPAVPAALADDPDWGGYLRSRAEQVRALAAAVAARAHAWAPASAPAWASSLIDRAPRLLADLAIWRAANGITPTDRRPTGPALPGAAEAGAQRALDQRVRQLLGDPQAATARWTPLVSSINVHITADPYWPTLADRLAIADRAGINIAALTRSVAAQAPLPDEQPAAALWWRLSRHLSPAALSATDRSASQTLRPAWIPSLAGIIGEQNLDRVLADPAWPGLVAAVTHGVRNGWQPAQLLAAAHELLRSGQPDDAPLRPAELATALAWRIGLLTGNTTNPNANTHGPDAGSAGQPGPDSMDPADLALLPSPVAASHEDWVTNLPQREYEPENTEDDGCFEHPAAATPTMNKPGGASPAGDAAVGIPPSSRTGPQVATPIGEAGRRDTPPVDRDRILELNAQAADFFAARYPESWAAAYLADRLGSDLTGDDRFPVGYAPAGWTALSSHLRARGAADIEIVESGLGSFTATGRVIDRFRDRLMFPIIDGEEIHGFIGRRNPNSPEQDNAGPKYLNTTGTRVFIKGREMYGLSEAAAALAAGASPVLAEGPIDAIAITLAGRGQFVGVAPLGTAFTDVQADKLIAYLGAERPGVIVATDNDQAGAQAAQRMFWRLTARGGDPRHLTLAAGTDPAETLQTRGLPALHAALTTAGSLAEALIDARITRLVDRLDTVEGRVRATRSAAAVIGALPPAAWTAHLPNLIARTDISPAVAIAEMLDAGHAWTEDPHGQAKTRMAERTRSSGRPDHIPPTTNPAPPPAQRWAALADSISPQLSADPGWPALAETLDQAAASGYNVPDAFPDLAARDPLPDRHLARSLQCRLLNVHPDALTATNTQAARAASRSDEPIHGPSERLTSALSPGRSPSPASPSPAPDRPARYQHR